MLLVETRKEASHSDAMQYLGTGWQRKLFARKTGSRFDINIISPEGKRFREYSRLVKYLKRTRNKVVQEKEVEQFRQLFRLDGLNSSMVCKWMDGSRKMDGLKKLMPQKWIA